MSSIHKAILYSSASQYLGRLIGLISIVMFSRLLTPSEIGVFAIASSVALIASDLRLLGTGSYLVRETEISEQKIRSGIGLTMIISWSLGFLLIVSATWFGDFYGVPDLKIIMLILSFSFFLAPFISVTSSIFVRNLQFKKLYIVKLLSSLGRFFITILLIFKGYSYFSLAWGTTFGVVCEFVLIAFFKPANVNWLPSFDGLKPILKFGILVSLTNLLRRLDETLPSLIIGKVGSTGQVAIFSRGMGLMSFFSQLIISGIQPVSLPYLSNAKRNSGNLKDAYIKAVLLLGAICWPILAVIGAASYPAIMLMFGNQWEGAVSIASILSLWILFRVIHTLLPSLLITLHNESILFFKQLAVSVVTALCIYFSYPYGLENIAWALVISAIFDFLLSSWVIYNLIGLGILKFMYEMRINIFLTFVCWGVTKFLDYQFNFNQQNSFVSVVIIAIILPLVWFVIIILFRHPIYSEIKKILKK